MGFLEQLKTVSWAGNTGYDYFLAIAIFVALIIVLKIFQMIILARLNQLAKRTKTDFDDTLIEVFKKIKPPFYFFISVYFAIKVLTLHDLITKAFFILFFVALIYEIVRALERLLDYLITKQLYKNQGDEASKEHTASMVRTLQLIVRVVLWLIGITLLLANFGVDVTSLIAGLGIGGIAIALALQNVLGDMFSSFSIYMDKPFQVGDFIVVGKDKGTVEKIGLKTTRLKSIEGNQLIISNQELTSARVHNYKRMKDRRISFSIGVTYDTPAKDLQVIPKMIKEIIDKVKLATYDRCYFVEYGDFSINFDIVYFVDSADYVDYLKTRQTINLAIYRKFAKEDIEFAYPTQTILLDRE